MGVAVIGTFGWQQLVVTTGPAHAARRLAAPTVSAALSRLLKARPSLALGALGMPGATAYFGATITLHQKKIAIRCTCSYEQ